MQLAYAVRTHLVSSHHSYGDAYSMSTATVYFYAVAAIVTGSRCKWIEKESSDSRQNMSLPHQSQTSSVKSFVDLFLSMIMTFASACSTNDIRTFRFLFCFPEFLKIRYFWISWTNHFTPFESGEKKTVNCIQKHLRAMSCYCYYSFDKLHKRKKWFCMQSSAIDCVLSTSPEKGNLFN